MRISPRISPWRRFRVSSSAFAGPILTIGQKEDALGNEVSQNTLRPTRYVPPNFPVTPAKAGSSSRNTSLVDDYSDMAFDEDEPELEAKMAGLKVGSPSYDRVVD